MRRRDLLVLFAGGVALPPLRGVAQSAMPVVGVLDSGTAAAFGPTAEALRKGLAEAGFVEGRNVRIETRLAEGHYDRLPLLAAQLVRMPVAVLAATGITAALAAQKATATIPVTFSTGGDPVKAGLVASLSRPGGNVTGVVNLGKILLPKQFEVLHELVPKADPVAFLVNPQNGVAASDRNSMRDAARAKGVQLQIVEAENDREIEAAFATLVERKVGALVIQQDPFFDGRRQQIVALAALHAVPVVAPHPEFAAVGGLISYGNSYSDGYRLEGNYVGRILKGEKPADLPVQQSAKIVMIVNLKTAQAPGLTVPPSLLARADEVIE